MTAEASLAEGEKTAGEGVEWLENKPYDNSDGTMPASPITGVLPPRGKGQYTLKKLHFKSKIPGILAALAPSSSLYLIEEVRWASAQRLLLQHALRTPLMPPLPFFSLPSPSCAGVECVPALQDRAGVGLPVPKDAAH